MNIRKKVAIVSILGIAALLSLLAAGCGPDASPSPPPQSAPISTPVNSPSPTPETQREITPSPLDGLVMPPVDERGYRGYEWEQQPVSDWLGDFPGADSIRLQLLERYSDTRFTDAYYNLFIGRPKAVGNGYIIPAGKRSDGEWMPELHYFTGVDGSFEIQFISQADSWFFTYSAFPTGDGEIRTLFGHPEIYQEGDPQGLIVTVEYDDGSTVEDYLPPGYFYLLAINDSGAEVMDIRAAYEGNDEPVQWGGFGGHYDWRTTTGETKSKALRRNMTFYPAMSADTDPVWWETIPKLIRINSNDLYFTDGRPYCCDLQNDDTKLLFYPPMPPDQISARILESGRGLKLKGEEITLCVEQSVWGNPIDLRATLYSKAGKTEITADAQGILNTGTVYGTKYYILHVQAQFSGGNRCEWILPLGNNEE